MADKAVLLAQVVQVTEVVERAPADILPQAAVTLAVHGMVILVAPLPVEAEDRDRQEHPGVAPVVVE